MLIARTITKHVLKFASIPSKMHEERCTSNHFEDARTTMPAVTKPIPHRGTQFVHNRVMHPWHVGAYKHLKNTCLHPQYPASKVAIWHLHIYWYNISCMATRFYLKTAGNVSTQHLKHTLHTTRWNHAYIIISTKTPVKHTPQ